METYAHANLVLVGVGIYLLGMLGIGYLASRKIQGQDDFLVAGRRLGTFFCTGTLFATWFGSGTCMGGAGNAYIFGNQGVLFDPWGAALCLLLSGLLFARLSRRGRFLTLVDLFDLRYGRAMGALACLTVCIAEIGWVGAQLVGFGTILSIFGGISMEVGILLSTLLLILYTWLGGMWAVTLTDVIQMIIIIAGLLLMLAAILPEVGGWSVAFRADTDTLMGTNRWDFLPTSQARADPTNNNAGFLYYTGYMGWCYWLAALLAIGLGSLPAQDLMQRTLSARTEQVAVRSSYLAGLMYCTVGLLPVLLGMLYFQVHPDLTVDDAMNRILLLVAVEYLPPWATVLFVSALISALMSSSDSAILAGASCIGRNGLRYVRPDVSEETQLKVVRFSIPVIAGLALILAMYFQTIYNLMVIAWSLLLVSLVVSYFGAYFWPRGNQTGAVSAFVAGFVCWVIAYWLHLPLTTAANTDVLPGMAGVYTEWAMWDALYIGSVWGLLGSLVSYVLVSLLTRRVDPPRLLCDIDGNPLPVEGWLGLGQAPSNPAST